MMDVKAWPLACVFQYIELGQPKFPIITCICAVCIPDPEVPALHEGTCLWNSLWSLPPTCSISIFFIFFLLMCGANHKWIDLATTVYPSANICVCSVPVNTQWRARSWTRHENWKLFAAPAPVVPFLLPARGRAADCCCCADWLQRAGNEQSFCQCIFYPIAAAASYPVIPLPSYSFTGPVTLSGCNSMNSDRFSGCFLAKIKEPFKRECILFNWLLRPILRPTLEIGADFWAKTNLLNWHRGPAPLFRLLSFFLAATIIQPVSIV